MPKTNWYLHVKLTSIILFLMKHAPFWKGKQFLKQSVLLTYSICNYDVWIPTNKHLLDGKPP